MGYLTFLAQELRAATAEELAEFGAALAPALELASELSVAGAAPATGPEPWLSVAEVAERCDLHDETVRRAIRAGDLEAAKLRSQWRVSLAALEAWTVTWTVKAPAAAPAPRQAPRRRGVPSSTDASDAAFTRFRLVS